MPRHAIVLVLAALAVSGWRACAEELGRRARAWTVASRERGATRLVAIRQQPRAAP